MTLKVEFARDDNSVTVIHSYVGTYNYEDLDMNKEHGYVTSPNLTKEDIEANKIQPLTREQFTDSLSADEKEKVLLPAYQKYVEDKGLSDKFTNEIP